MSINYGNDASSSSIYDLKSRVTTDKTNKSKALTFSDFNNRHKVLICGMDENTFDDEKNFARDYCLS